MKLLIVAALLACITAVHSSKQEVDFADAAEANDSVLSHSSDVDQSEDFEQLSDEELEVDDGDADDSTPIITYIYEQGTGNFKGTAKDGSAINVYGCSGARAGATVSGTHFPTCRNEPNCQCVQDKGPLPQAMCGKASSTSTHLLPRSPNLSPHPLPQPQHVLAHDHFAVTDSAALEIS